MTDSSGAVVPDASVTLTNAATSVALRANSDQAGSYSFPSVPPGVYSLEVTKEGFAPYKVAEFRVEGSPQVSLVWSSTNPAALQPLRGGLFYARAAGRVEVCAESEGARLCRSIRVVRRLSQ